jgi:hypothetical protein
MRVRLLYGIVVGLLMLHLTFVGADLSCAQHGDAPARGHQHGMMDHHRGDAASVHELTPASEQPCETPTQPGCCRAMTSCAINIAFGNGSALGELPPRHARIASSVSDAPPSQTAAPEPPPPKA